MDRAVDHNNALVTWFDDDDVHHHLPTAFTYPFFYTPCTLSRRAAEALMAYLETDPFPQHNFGLRPNDDKRTAIGKMFGVLVVQHADGRIGWLKAFSGKLANSNWHQGFVPPLFDMLDPNGFYIKGEQALNALNQLIWDMEADATYQQNLTAYQQLQAESQAALQAQKVQMKLNKANRQAQREAQKTVLDAEAYDALLADLVKQSHYDQYILKQKQRDYQQALQALAQQIDAWEQTIATLKQERKQASNALQQRLFDQYHFLNALGESANVRNVFASTVFDNPPAGAGECATPKMLQYAYQNGLKPLAMAEFWWGQSPVSEVRQHKQYYPACRGKCEPILGHMLQGVKVAPNPMLQLVDKSDAIETIYEDEHIVVVNKPAEFLSVPGKTVAPSVLSVLKARYPHATGPLLVHRLDMSTSGLLIAAKTKETHQNLQAQFIKKTAKKRYVALLEGELKETSGRIELPLRVDLDNRPHQLVCYEYGKRAVTEWELISIEAGRTRVYFYPITGRTHQLRVHAAHALGLGTPIVGDDLYGNLAERLHLHAEQLTIKHPVTKQVMTFHAPAPF